MTPEDFAALFQEPDKQAELIAALRRQRAAGNFGVLTGDKVLGDFGRGLVTQSGQSEANALAQQRLDEASRRTAAYEASVRAAAERAANRPAPDEEMAALKREALDLQNQKLKKTLAARPKAPKGDGGKLLPATTVEGLAELPVAQKAVDDLVGTFHRLNMGGMSGRAGNAVTGLLGLQGTDSAEYNAAAKLAMQAAGKILEGGKLAAGDEVKYAAMLPRAGDAPDVVAQKAEGMKAFLGELASRRGKGLKAAGYNVPAELIPGETPAATPTASESRRIVRNPKTGERRYLNADGSLGEAVP